MEEVVVSFAIIVGIAICIFLAFAGTSDPDMDFD